MIQKILTSLNLSEAEIETYLCLLQNGPLTAGKIAKLTGTPRPTVYGFLKKLVQEGIIVESVKDGVKLFVAEPPQRIKAIFQDRIEHLQTQKNAFETLIPDLENQMQTGLFTPRFKLFEGREGIENVLKDMLLYSGIETRSYWPMQAMVDILSPDFFEYHNITRIRNKVSVKAIWPHDQIIKPADHPYLGAGKDYRREIRIAPKNVKFTMGYWIYKNKIAFLSSLRESFAFIIESAEMAEMMTSQHEMMWQASQTLAMDEKALTDFSHKLSKL